MSDYKMVPVVANDDMLNAILGWMPRSWSNGWDTTIEDASELYAALMNNIPPFVVTDEMVERACKVAKTGWYKDEAEQMRAAIEAVLGGGA